MQLLFRDSFPCNEDSCTNFEFYLPDCVSQAGILNFELLAAKGSSQKPHLNFLRNLLCRNIRIAHGDASYHKCRKLFKCFFADLIIAYHDRYSLVTSFTDALNKRDLAEERNI